MWCLLGTPQKQIQKRTVAPPFPKSARSFDRSLMTHKFGPGARRAVGLKFFLKNRQNDKMGPLVIHGVVGPLYMGEKYMRGVINKGTTTV